MAKIAIVDYQNIPNKADQIIEAGQDINTKIIDTYTRVEDMKNAWFGYRYNNVTMEFSKVIDNMEEMLRLVIEKIPTALYTIASNYSKADSQNPIGIRNEQIRTIPRLSGSNEVTMRFYSEQVTDVYNNAENNFGAIIGLMGNIQSIYDSIVWESEAADLFGQRFRTLKSEIENSFSSIQILFRNEMTGALEDIGGAEDANSIQE